MSDAYRITRDFAERTARAVRRVESLPYGAADSLFQNFRLEEMQARATGGSSVSVGTYSTTGEQWEKGQFTNVHEYELSSSEGGGYTLSPKYSSGSPVTVSVLNLFVTIPPNYDTVRYCAYASVGGVNLLIAAEC